MEGVAQISPITSIITKEECIVNNYQPKTFLTYVTCQAKTRLVAQIFKTELWYALKRANFKLSNHMHDA